MKWNSLNVTSLFLITSIFILTTLTSVGFLSKAHIGSITWGPTTDLWAMSIAISKINYGLKGGIGYKTVTNELAKHLTTSGNVNETFDSGTRMLNDNYKSVTKALIAGSSLDKAVIQNGPMNNNFYVTMRAEDIGYADFYEVALRLFGPHAYSTHYLYFTILLLSITIFIISYSKDITALILLALATTSLFLTSASSLFSESVPSFAANRFLSTLAIVPLLHIVNFFYISHKIKKSNIFWLIAQSLLFAFAVKLRTSATWMILYLCIFSCFAALIYLKSISIGNNNLTINVKNVISDHKRFTFKIILLVALPIIFGYGIIRYNALDPVYATGDVTPYHTFWHSTYLGLTYHPDWNKNLPYKELEDKSSDNIAWTIHELYRQKDPQQYKMSEISGIFKIREHERIIRSEYLSFVRNHPAYMIELLFYYKPIMLYYILKDTIHDIPYFAWVIACFTFFVIALIARLKSCLGLVNGITLSLCIFSYIPVIWTYPGKHVLGDQTLISIMVLLTLFLNVIFLIINFCKGQLFKIAT